MARLRKISIADEAHTVAFARRLAPLLKAGDTVLLSGEIGAGKTFFTRAVIQSLLREPEDVPSPTFTLVQTYDAGQFDIWHCDLYRISGPDDARELGLEDAFDNAVCLIEWPDRLGRLAPSDALTLLFSGEGPARAITVEGNEAWRQRLEMQVA